MITDELSTGIIEAVKTKLPQKDNLANTLMDILYIGKEATYWKIQCKLPPKTKRFCPPLKHSTMPA